MSDTDRELRVSKIRNGTVIDHLAAGQALNVLALLGIDGSGGESVSVGMNVPSDKLAKKDIVKVEDRELSQSEVDVLAVIAPEATINIVREYDVVEKKRIDRPESVDGVLSCPNRNCITNDDEPIRTRFAVLDDALRCDYCGEIVREDEVATHLDVA
ncbi:aspartate carbamoyltransferase regulatory subunit [Halobellus limi]|jgi:aspartate carbamoyltransferase regulatory subunit|uniref:Aspartate carbamoyltransferase regulatory chain n=1 Tax=Halobellus limi TaxID=699433 RepID=A0A1H5ZZX1_9EURY|nr:aspartate carbamoyltransferase regulatory subunit [Halobellus limi]QCC47877.1 aspartate carbamoyltransferase regulatory subunit [Halobellus limi]SEG41710.1 aspartate carbamoyltransferase regulatory subunit [Halobellus limi]